MASQRVTDPPDRRPLDIDLEELIVALSGHDPVFDSAHYLDRETGELVFVSDGVDEEDLPPGFDAEDGERWIFVRPIESSESWSVMEAFVEQLPEDDLARSLDRALHGRKPFRRFKDALYDHPEQRQAWFDFQHEQMERIARERCEAEGIAPRWVGRRFGSGGESGP